MVVSHELKHVLDAIQFTPLFFVLSYLLAFPVLLTMRAFWEWRAVQASIEEIVRVYGDVSEAQLDAFADTFVGPGYLWMATGRAKWRKRIGDFASGVKADYAKDVADAMAKIDEALNVSSVADTIRDNGLADMEIVGRA